jgi:hypothetical protein
MSKFPKGSKIYKRAENRFKVHFSFRNVLKETMVSTIEEAMKKAHEFDIAYFSTNTQYLPIGVTYSNTDKTFNLFIHHPISNKTINLGSYKTIKEVRKARKRVLNNLIGL